MPASRRCLIDAAMGGTDLNDYLDMYVYMATKHYCRCSAVI
jgi:hypothetical protein